MFLGDKFDRIVRRTLVQIARQRVRMVLQPGSYWVIENTGKPTADTHAALMTCYMRGWIEPLPYAVPSASLPPDSNISQLDMTTIEQQYRPTSAGWSATHRTQTIAIVALSISALSLCLVVARTWLK